MYIVIFFTCIAIFFTYLDVKGNFKNGMLWGFILITLLQMVHYDYGNDYMSYYTLYQENVSSAFDLQDIIEGTVFRDPGWIILCYAFKHIGGFFMMVAAISLFEGWAFYNAIKDWLPKNLWVFGVTIYLIHTSYYLLNFSMLRQGFTIAVFLAIWPWVKERKWWYCLAAIIGASFIHGSAKVLLPFAFWGFLPMKNAKYWVLSFIGIIILLNINGALLNDLSTALLGTSKSFEYYMNTYEGGNTTGSYGLGYYIYMIPVFVSLWFLYKNEDGEKDTKLLVALSCIGTIVSIFAASLPMVGRIGMYFGAYSIVSLPIVYNYIQNKGVRIALISLFIFIHLYDYFLFFNSEVFSEKYTEFHTIFSVI